MPTRPYNILIDPSTAATLALSSNRAAIIILQECTADTIAVPDVQFPNYTYSLFHEEPLFLARIPASEYPRWKWEFRTNKFLRLDDALVSERLVKLSALAVARTSAIESVLAHVSYARNSLITGVPFQESVYIEKRAQARKFKKSGFDEALINEIPYVVQYADLVEVSLKQAAEDILFKAKLDENILLKTEAIRMTYLRKIKEASAPEDLKPILESLRRDSNRWQGMKK